MDSQKQLINEVSAIAIKIQREFEGNRLRWPRVVRERVAILIRSGNNIDELAQSTSIPLATLFRWAKNMGITVKRPRKSDGHFIPVSTSRELPVSLAQSRDFKLSRDKNLTIKFEKSHAIVTGSVPELAELLRLMESAE